MIAILLDESHFWRLFVPNTIALWIRKDGRGVLDTRNYIFTKTKTSKTLVLHDSICYLSNFNNLVLLLEKLCMLAIKPQ